MAQNTFRCYAYRAGPDHYESYCLDLTLAGKGRTMQEAIADLEDAILGYLESVYELGWEQDLVPRRARLGRWVEYYKLLLIHSLKALFSGEFGGFQTFLTRFEGGDLVYA